jgi:hypothetical protein
LADFTFRLEGLEKLLARLKPAPTKATVQLGGALNLEGELIMTKAKRRTPVDLGTLRASGFVTEPKLSRNKARVILGFGGAASSYALAVHEHPSRHSPPSWSQGVDFTVGGPQYLRTPVKNAQKGIGRRLARHLDLF